MGCAIESRMTLIGSRDLMRFPRHSSAVDSGMVERQETQIVQSGLTLDDILP